MLHFSESGGPIYQSIIKKMKMLQPLELNLEDESYKHAGHAGKLYFFTLFLLLMLCLLSCILYFLLLYYFEYSEKFIIIIIIFYNILLFDIILRILFRCC